MGKLTLGAADSLAVSQYLEKSIGVRGLSEIKRELGPLTSDIALLVGKLVRFESVYPGIVASVVAFIIGLLTNKDVITQKLDDPAFVESERERFKREVVIGVEKSPAVSELSNGIDELYATLVDLFAKISKSQDADSL